MLRFLRIFSTSLEFVTQGLKSDSVLVFNSPQFFFHRSFHLSLNLWNCSDKNQKKIVTKLLNKEFFTEIVSPFHRWGLGFFFPQTKQISVMLSVSTLECFSGVACLSHLVSIPTVDSRSLRTPSCSYLLN